MSCELLMAPISFKSIATVAQVARPQHNTNAASLAMDRRRAPNIKDSSVRSGRPIFSWEGQGLWAWWYCRRCRELADDGHLKKEKHRYNISDWEAYPEGCLDFLN